MNKDQHLDVRSVVRGAEEVLGQPEKKVPFYVRLFRDECEKKRQKVRSMKSSNLNLCIVFRVKLNTSQMEHLDMNLNITLKSVLIKQSKNENKIKANEEVLI